MSIINSPPKHHLNQSLSPSPSKIPISSIIDSPIETTYPNQYIPTQVETYLNVTLSLNHQHSLFPTGGTFKTSFVCQ